MQNFYDLSTADLQKATITNEVLNRMIAPSVISGEFPDTSALLASILKNQLKANSKYRIYPFSITAGNWLQILPDNPDRTGLLVASLGGGDVSVLLEQTTITQAPLDAATLARAFVLLGSITTPFEFWSVPSNPVTIAANTGTGAIGVILEGV